MIHMVKNIFNLTQKIEDKILISSTALMLLCAAAALLFKQLSVGAYLILGLWSVVFLVYIIIKAIKISKINLGTKYYAVIAVSIAISIGIYTYVMINENTVHIWDYATYWKIALTTEQGFNQSFFYGVGKIVGSIWFSEYNRFIVVFTYPFYFFSSKSIHAFMISYFIVGVIPFTIIFSVIFKGLIDKIKPKNEFMTFCVGIICLNLFPLLHAAALRGMPDIFGMVFIGIIILLTLDYEFIFFEKERLVWLSAAVICLFIIRRWYVFWIIGYSVSFIMVLLLSMIIKRKKNVIKKISINLLKFIVGIGIAFVVLFIPMIIRVLSYDYGDKYSSWKNGGLVYEILSQYARLGIIFTFILLIGAIFGCINRKMRTFAICAVLTLIISMTLFNRIQNIGEHQSLILVPSYILLSFLFVIGISCIKTKFKIVLSSMYIVYAVINFYGGITNNSIIYGNNLFSNINLKPAQREDMKLIKEITDFINDNCSDENKACIISGSNNYNVDVFRNYGLPNLKMLDIIYEEASVDSTHGFPIGFFDAKYVLVSDPVQQGGYSNGDQKVISIPSNAITNEPSISKKFKLVKTVKYEEVITYYIYERIEKVDEEEKEYFINEFNKYYPQYKDLYEDRIKGYSSEKTLN